jgi:hypothetical protein
MFGLLLWRLALRLGRGRTVIIAEGHVTVRERGPFRNRLWSAPLSRFVGVAHRVRSSLSGIRHEIMLVHPECARSVMLEIGDRIEQARIDEVSGLLGLRQVPAHALYGAPNSTVIAPNAALQAAPS